MPISLVTMLWLKAPLQFVMLTLLPLAPTLATLVIEAIGLAEFNRMFDLDVRWRDYVKLVVGAVPLPARARRGRDPGLGAGGARRTRAGRRPSTSEPPHRLTSRA